MMRPFYIFHCSLIKYQCISVTHLPDKQDEKADSFPAHEESDSPAVPDQEAQPSPSTYEAGNVPASNFTGIHIPPGAHAPANTPAEVPHSTGRIFICNL